MRKSLIITLNIVVSLFFLIGCSGSSSDSDSGPKSSNANLADLIITLPQDNNEQLVTEPVFDTGVYDYSVSLDCSDTDITIEALLEDDNASVMLGDVLPNREESTTGGLFFEYVSLQEGENVKNIVVTAQDGSTLNYVLTIHCTNQPALLFEGIYVYTPLIANYPYQYFRFYEEDNTVISVTSYGEAEDVRSWFNRDHAAVGQGTYSITSDDTDGRMIAFTIRNKYGDIDYSGRIFKRRLYLDYVSHIYSTDSVREYKYSADQ